MVMARCTKCGQKMEKAELRRHWAEKHTPEWIKCSECGCQIKTKHLKRHMKSTHPKGAGKPEKKELSAKEKRALFRPEYDKPMDFLDRPNVVSGGGFGVGKGKKR